MIRTPSLPRALRRSARQAGCAMLALAAAMASPAYAQGDQSIALRDSFRVGTAGVLCTAQYRPTDAALTSMFDRGYRVVCRDAASPVGSLYALRGGEGDRLEAYLQMLATRLTCGARQVTEVEGVGGATVIECSDPKASVDYRVYVAVRGDTVFVAEGLSGYDSALKLALAASRQRGSRSGCTASSRSSSPAAAWMAATRWAGVMGSWGAGASGIGEDAHPANASRNRGKGNFMITGVAG